MRRYVTIEHLLVFAAFGPLLSSAYPNRLMFICCLVLLGVPLLEYLQTMTADRHGTVQDACEKVAGGLLCAGGMHVAIRCLNAPPIKRQVIRGCRKAEPENSTSLIVESHLPCSSVGDRKLRLAPSERLPPKELKPAEEPGRASYGRVRPPRSRMRTGTPSQSPEARNCARSGQRPP